MAKVALDDAVLEESTASNHINYKYDEWDSTDYQDSEGNWQGGWDTYSGTTNAKINGTCSASSNQVFVNGVNAVLNGDTTIEDDTIVAVAGGYDYTGDHNGESGTVTNGNASNVFIGGKSVALEGSTVKTHANTNTTIKSGGSNNVFIGG